MTEYDEQAIAAQPAKSYVRTCSMYFEYPIGGNFSLLQRREKAMFIGDEPQAPVFLDEFVVRRPADMGASFPLLNPETNEPLPGNPTLTYQELFVALFSFAWANMVAHDAELPAEGE
jgi:hypothetical protein